MIFRHVVMVVMVGICVYRMAAKDHTPSLVELGVLWAGTFILMAKYL